jgi:hypothetical protein
VIRKAVADARDAAELTVLKQMGAEEAKRRIARTKPAA